MRKLIALSGRIVNLKNVSSWLLDVPINPYNFSRVNLSTTTRATIPLIPIYEKHGKMLDEKDCHGIKCGERFSTSCALAKSKDRGKDKKKVDSKHHIDTREMSQVMDVEHLTKQCEKQLEIFKNNLVKHASLRPTSGAIEELAVPFEGTTYALHELASVVRKANIIVVNVTEFPQVIPNILESFKRHESNLNPQQDGTTIYITLPKITKELRQSLVKSTNAIFIKTRDNIKEIRNKEMKKLRKNEENHPIDLIERVQAHLEAFIQRYVNQAAQILEKKQKELQGEAEE